MIPTLAQQAHGAAAAMAALMAERQAEAYRNKASKADAPARDARIRAVLTDKWITAADAHKLFLATGEDIDSKTIGQRLHAMARKGLIERIEARGINPAKFRRKQSQ